MADFKVYSDFEPQGSQPQAIKHLSNGIESGQNHQTLLVENAHGQLSAFCKKQLRTKSL